MKPDGPVLSKHEWFVKPCDRQAAADLIAQYHYSGSTSAFAIATFGLFHQDTPDIARGCTWWLPAMVTPSVERLGIDRDNIVSLARLVVEPDAPKNAATFMLMRSMKQLDKWWQAAVTYADTWQGHTGGIYKAAGWLYDGMTDPRPVYLTAEGQMTAERKGDVTYTHKEMLAMGHTFLGRYEKHRYVWIRDLSTRQKNVAKGRQKIDISQLTRPTQLDMV